MFLKNQSWVLCIFNINMCDLLLCDCKYKIINYADDITFYTYEPNKGHVLSKLEKEASTVSTWCQNNYLKTNSKKSHLLATSDNVPHINIVGINSSSKYEELLGIFIDHKLTFEDHHLNIDQKVALAKRSKCMSQKKLRITIKAFVTLQFAYCPLIWMFHNRRIDHKINKLHEKALKIVYKDHFHYLKNFFLKTNLSQSIKEIFK